MKDRAFVRKLKEASACLRKFESERKLLEEKVAESSKSLADKAKELDAQKIAMELILDELTLKDIQEKTAALKEEDLDLVRKAMELDLSKKVASLGELSTEDGASTLVTDPVTAFMSVLKGNR